MARPTRAPPVNRIPLPYLPIIPSPVQISLVHINRPGHLDAIMNQYILLTI
jgi:hypothetical protein